jgi:hypothetical protein
MKMTPRATKQLKVTEIALAALTLLAVATVIWLAWGR